MGGFTGCRVTRRWLLPLLLALAAVFQPVGQALAEHEPQHATEMGLNDRHTNSLVGNEAGSFHYYQILRPTVDEVQLTLTYGPPQSGFLGHAIGLEVWQWNPMVGKVTLASADDSPVSAEVRSFREVLAEQAVGVLVRAALPGCGVREFERRWENAVGYRTATSG